MLALNNCCCNASSYFSFSKRPLLPVTSPKYRDEVIPWSSYYC